MKKIILSIIALALFSGNVKAQLWQDITWTNGGEAMVGEELKGGQVLFNAYGFYDAGYGYLFNVKKTGANAYDLQGTSKMLQKPVDKQGRPFYIVEVKTMMGAGMHMKRKEVNRHDLLIHYDEKGKVESVYEQTSEDMREYTGYKIMQFIEGRYYDSKGKLYEFSDNGDCIIAGRKARYAINFNTPAPGFIIDVEEEVYYLTPTVKGMDINIAKYDKNEESYSKGDLIASLKADNNTYRWSFTSAYPCSSYLLGLLSKDVLRLLRNEIYARSGWTFTSADLVTYFSSCKWYRSAGNNNVIKFSGMETLNASLIKYAEEH